MEIWMDVDTALAEVPVNVLPLIDDTDFKTRETAVAYNAAGMDLVWNFVTTAGAFTQTAVTPTTVGDYDWTHQGDGMYTIEIPAAGGISINNDTEGYGWFTGVATGVLPWRGPFIGFRAAALNNALIDGGDVLDVNIAEISDDTAAAINAEAFFDGTGYAGTGNTIPTVTTVNGLAAGVITAAAIATGAIDADALAADAAAEIADAVWDEDATAHQTQGTFGQAIGDPVADTNTIFKAVVSDASGATVGVDSTAILADTNELQTDWVNGGRLDLILDARASQTSVDTLDDFVDTEVAAILAAVDTEIGTIQTTLSTTGVVLTSTERNAVRDAIFARAFSAAYGSYTFDELMKLFAAVLVGKASGLATTTAVYRNLADSADVISATVDADGNRTAVTRTP